MTDQQIEGFGDYHPEAAAHPPYNETMAAWHNQVASMRQSRELPTTPESPEETSEPAQESQEPSEEPGGTPEPEQSSEVSTETSEQPEQVPESRESEAPEETPKETSGEATKEDLFDPSTRNAPEVLLYLDGAGFEEAQRVLELEEQGKARKGILNNKDEILQREKGADDRLASTE